jgi:hypothetical protein
LALSDANVTAEIYRVHFLADTHPPQNAIYWLHNTATGIKQRAELKFAAHDKSLPPVARNAKIRMDGQMQGHSVLRILQGDDPSTATAIDQTDTSTQVWRLIFLTDSGS